MEQELQKSETEFKAPNEKLCCINLKTDEDGCPSLWCQSELREREAEKDDGASVGGHE